MKLKPDIICVTESWLNESVPDDAITIFGYNVFRSDRTTQKGGGICAWIKSIFEVNIVVNKSNCKDAEVLLLRVRRKRFTCFLLILYLPHGQSLNVADKQDCCDYIISLLDGETVESMHAPIFVTGDFNRVNTAFLEASFCLENVVHEPTRKDVTLDLILVPTSLTSSYVKPSFYPPLASSDHAVIYLKPVNGIPANNEYKKIVDFRDSHLSNIYLYLGSLDFGKIFSNLSLDDMCVKFYSILHDCLDSLPYDMIKIKSNDKPWMNAVVKVLINKRYRAYRTRNWSLYYHYRSKVTAAIAKAKLDWGARMKQEKVSIWKVRDKVIGTPKDPDWLPKCDQNISVREILEILNDRYISHMQADSPNYKPSPFVVPYVFKKAEIEEMLAAICTRKSTGSDGIPAIAWIKLSSVLSEPLCHIFNTCMITANLPSKWKTAHVVPVPKTQKPTLYNTRPISLLPLPARLLERKLIKWYSSDFSQRSDSNQFAYRKKGSTTCALIQLTEYIANTIADPKVQACHLVAIDMEKGFDKLSHSILLEKMYKDTLDPFLTSFTSNYLTDRYQSIRWKSTVSNPNKILSGVPQGSLLGPTIFSYFTSDLQINNDACLVKYADDITICAPVKQRPEESPIHKAFSTIKSWMSTNKMNIKAEKCQQMFISLRQTSNLEKAEIKGIPTVSKMKLLGVILDSNLNWNHHTDYLARKASSRTFILRQLKPFLDKQDMISIYCACIRGILEYCAPLFVNLNASQSNTLERVQKRCHRIICGSSSCSCTHFVPLDYRRIVLGWKLFMQLITDVNHPLHHLLPPKLTFSNKYVIPIGANSIVKRSFLMVMVKLFNSGFSL